MSEYKHTQYNNNILNVTTTTNNHDVVRIISGRVMIEDVLKIAVN